MQLKIFHPHISSILAVLVSGLLAMLSAATFLTASSPFLSILFFRSYQLISGCVIFGNPGHYRHCWVLSRTEILVCEYISKVELLLHGVVLSCSSPYVKQDVSYEVTGGMSREIEKFCHRPLCLFGAGVKSMFIHSYT